MYFYLRICKTLSYNDDYEWIEVVHPYLNRHRRQDPFGVCLVFGYIHITNNDLSSDVPGHNYGMHAIWPRPYQIWRNSRVSLFVDLRILLLDHSHIQYATRKHSEIHVYQIIHKIYVHQTR